MKIAHTYFLLLVVLFGCNTDTKLEFESYSRAYKACDNCPDIQITIPRALAQSKLNKAINDALTHEVISMLHFDDDDEVTTIDSAFSSFTNGFKKLEELYDDETTPWEASMNAEVVYEDAAVLTIEFDAYLFTGGAHGYNAKRFLNFDTKKGTELESWQLFKDSLGFQNFAEKKFRQKENIPLDKSINYTGFMFDNNSFHLPENIGFTTKGIKLLYNQYEVSSFADGTVELILPYNEVAPYLIQKMKS